MHQIPFKKVGTPWSNQNLKDTFSFNLQHGMAVYVSINRLLLYHFIHDHHKQKKNGNVLIPLYEAMLYMHLNLFYMDYEQLFHLL
jgi:hypothetical protein